jgi:hypothetical protein
MQVTPLVFVPQLLFAGFFVKVRRNAARRGATRRDANANDDDAPCESGRRSREARESGALEQAALCCPLARQS